MHRPVATTGGGSRGNRNRPRPPADARSGSSPPSAPTEIVQQGCEPRQRGPLLPLRPTHHHQVIGVAGQHPAGRSPSPVKPGAGRRCTTAGKPPRPGECRSPHAGRDRPASLPRKIARSSFSTAWSQTRSCTACIDQSVVVGCGARRTGPRAGHLCAPAFCRSWLASSVTWRAMSSRTRRMRSIPSMPRSDGSSMSHT